MKYFKRQERAEHKLSHFLPFWAILRHGKVVNVVKVSKPTYLVMIWHKRGPSVDVLLSGGLSFTGCTCWNTHSPLTRLHCWPLPWFNTCGNHNVSGCKIPNPSNFRGWNSQCLCLDQKVGAWQILWFVNKNIPNLEQMHPSDVRLPRVVGQG